MAFFYSKSASEVIDSPAQLLYSFFPGLPSSEAINLLRGLLDALRGQRLPTSRAYLLSDVLEHLSIGRGPIFPKTKLR